MVDKTVRLDLVKSNKKDQDSAALKAAFVAFHEILPEMVAYRRAAYLEYLKSGFTESQALEMCAKSVVL